MILKKNNKIFVIQFYQKVKNIFFFHFYLDKKSMNRYTQVKKFFMFTNIYVKIRGFSSFIIGFYT